MPTGPKKKITLDVLGRKMAYDGYEDHMERDLFKLMDKMNVSEADAVGVYRKNLPEASTTDSEVHERRAEARRVRDEKKKTKSDDPATAPAPAEQPPQAEAPAQQQPPPAQQQDPAPAQATFTDAPPTTDQQIQQQYDNNAGGTEFTAEYQDTLDNFIDKIVKTDRPTLQERISAPPQPSQHTVPPPAQQTAGGQQDAVHNRRGSVMDEEEVQQHARAGKIIVSLSLAGSDSSKMISVPATVSYDEFIALVEKKFAHHVMMHFKDDEELIDLDDDDTLSIFFESVQPGKKLKLYCKQPPPVVEDGMTKTVEEGEATRKSTQSNHTDQEDGPVKAELTTSADSTYTGHTGAIYCCGFAPNMDRFISASRDKSVRLWSMNDGNCTQMKGGHSEMVLSADFSPDAEHVVSSSVDPTIKMWKASTGSKFQNLKGHTDKVYCTRFNDTGKYIASASCDRSVRVWSAVRGSQLAKLEGHTLMVFSCDFSKTDNGKLLASASEDRLVKIWDWEKNVETCSLLSHTGPVWSCRFSKDDQYMVSASMDNEVKIWDLKMNKPLRTFKGHRVPVHDALFTPDGKWVFSCGRDNKILKWSTLVGESADAPIEVAEEFTGHTDIIYHIDYCEKGGKGLLLSCSLDQTVKLWKPTSK